MKGKNISGLDGFDLGMGMFASMVRGEAFLDDYNERKVENTQEDDWTVDTAFTRDTDCYETAISRPDLNEGGLAIRGRSLKGTYTMSKPHH